MTDPYTEALRRATRLQDPRRWWIPLRRRRFRRAVAEMERLLEKGKA